MACCTSGKAKYKIVFVRHGESEWNQKNLFCGWYDSSLSDNGLKEAKAGGDAIKNSGIKFDVAYTSCLKRAQHTLATILIESDQFGQVPIQPTWRLNERHYGGLTGLDKQETVDKYGAEQVQIWRRSFDVPPPTMGKDHPYWGDVNGSEKYKNSKDNIPCAESLELCIGRTMPFWEETIVPALKQGKVPIVAAHGNSLRGIVYTLDGMTNEQIMDLNLPTGIPFVYELDADFKPVVSMKFLGDEATVNAAIEKVKAQTGGGKK